MTPAVQSMVATTYVRDIETSRAFYELLGFREQSAGKAATSAWSALRHDGLSVLLASTEPALDIPRLPLLFYFYYNDKFVPIIRHDIASKENLVQIRIISRKSGMVVFDSEDMAAGKQPVPGVGEDDVKVADISMHLLEALEHASAEE